MQRIAASIFCESCSFGPTSIYQLIFKISTSNRPSYSSEEFEGLSMIPLLSNLISGGDLPRGCPKESTSTTHSMVSGAQQLPLYPYTSG